MLWEAPVSATLGLVMAWTAAHALKGRLPRRSLVLATGVVSALTGGLIARTVMGAGHGVAVLLIAAFVCGALLSLLLGERKQPTVLTVGVPARPAGQT